MYGQHHGLGNTYPYLNLSSSKSNKGFMNSTEKYLNKSVKITIKSLGVVLKKVVTMVTPARPPPSVQDEVFMTYVIKVDMEEGGWPKSLLAVLKKTASVRDFRLGQGGRIIVSASADLKAVLKGFGKAKVKVECLESGKCSSYLYLPQVGAHGNGYGYNYGQGASDYYGNNGNGMYPFRGGYGGVQERGYGYGYNPIGYNNNYRSFRQGENYMAPQAQYPLMDYGYNNNYRPFDNRQGGNYMAPQAQYSLMDDENMPRNCPCEF